MAELFFADSSYPDSLNHAEEEIETARSSRRRERKMKFDLKSVLNIRTTHLLLHHLRKYVGTNHLSPVNPEPIPSKLVMVWSR